MQMNSRTNLLGVVLCGGESKRMGSDKGLLQMNGKTWAEVVSEKLRQQNIPVVISINENQQDAYSRIFDREEFVIDQLPMHGPLNGLLTVHQQFPDHDILLMACDVVDMNDIILNELITAYEKNEAEYFAYEEDNFFQPLCAIYTSAAIQSLLERLQSGSLANYSFQYILNNSNTFRLHSSLKGAFTNYNTPDGSNDPKKKID
jgi:molybdopterin-guanine dinucleotide biosynthesis protein A